MKPVNNKSIFHTFANIVEECDKDKKTVANRELKIKALTGMQNSLAYELKRLKTLHDCGNKTAKLRDIELKPQED